MNTKPVLFVVTSNGVKGKSGIPTGFWLSEVTHALAKLDEVGIKVEFASILGGEPPVDGLDLDDAINAHYWNDESFRSALRTTMRLEDVDSLRYAAIFFAGGHGTMWDFPESDAVRRVVRQVWETGGIVSAVCHGPAALVNVVLSDGSWLVAGRTLAAFTNEEEQEVQATDIVPFLLETALKAHGADHRPAANWTTNVQVDGRLVTGQNPASAAGVGEALRHLLRPKSAVTRGQIRAVSPVLAKYTEVTIGGDLWKRSGLSPRDRSFATVAALIARNQITGMQHYFNLALDTGVTPSELSETITHLAFYSGWPNALSAVVIAKDIFSERGVGVDQLPAISPELLAIEQAVPDEANRVSFGSQNVRPVSKLLEAYTGDLLYHEVWLRPGLTSRDRSLVTISALIAGGDTPFLGLYLRRALVHGVTKDQVSELLGHLAFYSGWPKLISAALVVKEVFDSESQKAQ